MTDKIEDGGPAYPTGFGGQGMSLRDYFAGQALSGLLANSNIAGRYGETIGELYYRIASSAYAYADAMLAARKVKP